MHRVSPQLTTGGETAAPYTEQTPHVAHLDHRQTTANSPHFLECDALQRSLVLLLCSWVGRAGRRVFHFFLDAQPLNSKSAAPPNASCWTHIKQRLIKSHQDPANSPRWVSFLSFLLFLPSFSSSFISFRLLLSLLIQAPGSEPPR